MKRIMKRILIAALGCLFCASTAAAALPWGFWTGYTGDSDYKQWFVGGQLEVADLLPRTTLTPNIEIGFGDNITILALNLDLFYDFTELATHDWSFYAGAGVALNHFNPQDSDANTQFGLNIAGGVGYMLTSGNKLFGELRFGLEDSPDFKLALGFTWY